MKILAFDIWGEYGHFKKFYTTSTPLTFSVPPPTAVYGMIGAILGFEKDEYLNYINDKTTKIAIQILKPIKKTRFTLNLIDTKNSKSFHLIKNRTQIKTEFLKNPEYRIYTTLTDDNLFEKLISLIKQRKTYYTLSLGLANLLANFRFAGLYEFKKIENSEYIDSIILAENVEAIRIEEGKKYFKEKLPINMTSERIVTSYKDVIFELQGKGIKGNFKECFITEEKIVFSFLNG